MSYWKYRVFHCYVGLPEGVMFFSDGLFLLLSTTVVTLWICLHRFYGLWLRITKLGWVATLKYVFSCSPLFGEDELTHFDCAYFFSNWVGELNHQPAKGEDGFTLSTANLGTLFRSPLPWILVVCWAIKGMKSYPDMWGLWWNHDIFPIKQQRISWIWLMWILSYIPMILVS